MRPARGHGRGARRRTSVVVACVVALAAASVRAARLDLGFEAVGTGGLPVGWTVDDEDRGLVAVDSTVALEGLRSLRIEGDGREGAARAVLRIAPPDVEGNRLRITVRVKTEGVQGRAAPWVRLESDAGLLYVDRMSGAGASGTSDWTDYAIDAPVLEAATRLELGLMLSGRGTAWFDEIAIEGFDTRTLPAPSPAARRYVERALELIRDNSMMRDSIDWPSYRAGVLAQARGAATSADTYLALRYALARLGDHHSYLLAPDRASVLDLAPVSNARTGRPPVEPRGARLAGDVAYLSVPGFAGGSHGEQVALAERLQSLVRELDRPPICGWIVDLRRNSGGNLWPMLAGIGPLVGEGEAAAAAYPGGRRVPLWYRDGKAGLGDYVQLRVRGEPYRLARRAPIAVLLGPRTASSAEILAIALRGGPDRRSFGEPTRGVSTGTRTYTLSDGAALVLAVAATTDRNGAVHTGPILPDEPVANRGLSTPLAEQTDVQAALRWLHARCANLDDGIRSGAPVADRLEGQNEADRLL
ncbi:MAG TPA: S41 family peptidase [Gammaproteobacteria bacterium]